LTDSDDAGLVLGVPALEIRKTVVAAGDLCPATFALAADGLDTIPTAIGETVTYCFWVTNTGTGPAADVVVTDAGINYTSATEPTLAIGAEIQFASADVIVSATTPNPNTATVTGTDPAVPDGPALTDSDDAGLVLGVPALEIRKTVVAGGDPCPATFALAADGLDTIPTAIGQTVTYCFWVTNTGTGPATDVSVADSGINYTSAIAPTLAIGAEIQFASADVVVSASTPNPNTATVTGTDPANPAGPALTDSDDAGLVLGTPELEIRKTIVTGPLGTCPASFADAAGGLDILTVAPGDVVTYCFWVANTGSGPATDVIVTDANLGYTAGTIAILDGGATALAGQVDETTSELTPNPNIASVTGTDPANPNDPPLTANDPAGFSAPELQIIKTVLAGADAICPATFADAADGLDTIPTAIGETVTYCFWVANTGLTDATDVVVEDAGLGYVAPTIAVLAASDTALAGAVNETVAITTPNPNTATVTGVDPADPTGPALTDDDQSGLVLGTPVLEIRKTIVPGPAGTCPATFAAAADGLDILNIGPGDDVTYCFWVTNTGTGPATNVVVDDAGLGYTSTPIATLGASASALAGQVDVTTSANTPNPNTATVTGVDPANPNGPALTDSDQSGFSAPALEIIKTIVPGPAGTCPATFGDAADGLDTINTAIGDTVTYCFWVVNSGLTPAINVQVADAGLNYTAASISVLAAGEERLAGQVDEPVSITTPNPNTATVTGTDPENPTGPALTDSDQSGITGPVLEIIKTIVPGANGVCPATFADAADGLDILDANAGDTVTYCFWVLNSGLTEAINVEVADADLGFLVTIPTLAAQQEEFAGQVNEVVDIDTPNPNTATVTGTDPADPNGPPLTDSDQSGIVSGTPALEIRKTIVSGPTGVCPATFTAAVDGLDTLGVQIGDVVTYCFWVANTGDGPAIDVLVTDPDLGYSAAPIATLEGGDSVLAGQVDETIDAATPNPNTASVTGTDPLNPNTPLTDSDDSGIAVGIPFLEIRKTVVPGPTGACPTSFADSINDVDHLPTAIGDTVTYCFWVSNVGVGPAADVTVTDAAIGFTSTPAPLAAGAELFAGSQDLIVTATTPALNVATVTGIDPANPNDPPLTDDDPSVISGPVLEIRKTVVAGGTPCPATFVDAVDGDDTLATAVGETVTYCFWVANTGFTEATNVVVTDADLAYTAPAVPILGGGEEALAGQVDEVVDANTPSPNTAVVTGTDPLDPTNPTLTDQDVSSVSLGAPILEIRKTVVAGGTPCPATYADAIDGDDSIPAAVGDTVTYCFWVANIGTGPATDVVVSDNGLVYTAPLIPQLDPTDELLAGQVDEVVNADTPNPNTAEVTGVDPADPTGPRLADSDPSSLVLASPLVQTTRSLRRSVKMSPTASGLPTLALDLRLTLW